jgi:hypothetical protein
VSNEVHIVNNFVDIMTVCNFEVDIDFELSFSCLGAQNLNLGALLFLPGIDFMKPFRMKFTDETKIWSNLS